MNLFVRYKKEIINKTEKIEYYKQAYVKSLQSDYSNRRLWNFNVNDGFFHG